MPRPGQARQRLRRRAPRPRVAPALDHRPADAEDAPDLAPPRTAWPVLRRQGRVAESLGVTEPPSRKVDTEPTSPFLRACHGLPADRTPVWLLRQAGRYMPEYRALREQHSMLDVIRTPELAAQVTLMPVDAFGVDAAIVFSDILPPLVGMGLELDFVQGDGPKIGNPLSSPRDVDLLGTPPAEETMSGTLGAIALVRRELESRAIPVIGFAGAPFTLASYAIEGGTSKDFSKTKAFMLSEPAAWRRLLTKLATVQADYLLAQAQAGAQALQVFDSWAGRALGREDYLRYVAPVNRELYAAIATAGVPVINFSLGVSAYLAEAAGCGGDVVGLDWQLPLDEACTLLGDERPVQGNLDPASLLAPWRELQARADDVLERAAGRPGHIFNVGHGVVPQTSVDNVRRLVEHVRERTST
ncbi:MAG: uroporphyrinogen decarboxylase [Actinobacteria bacterium]|nr:uroporphyrinogen decarboxylase [Actinomycetota bacterium]